MPGRYRLALSLCQASDLCPVLTRIHYEMVRLELELYIHRYQISLLHRNPLEMRDLRLARRKAKLRRVRMRMIKKLIRLWLRGLPGPRREPQGVRLEIVKVGSSGGDAKCCIWSVWHSYSMWRSFLSSTRMPQSTYQGDTTLTHVHNEITSIYYWSTDTSISYTPCLPQACIHHICVLMYRLK